MAPLRQPVPRSRKGFAASLSMLATAARPFGTASNCRDRLSVGRESGVDHVAALRSGKPRVDLVVSPDPRKVVVGGGGNPRDPSGLKCAALTNPSWRSGGTAVRRCAPTRFEAV